MFGGLRLSLALMVALSHAGLSLAGAHLGVPAVIVFYLIAGLVTSAILERLRLVVMPFAIPRELALAYYRDRALRLLPTYFVVLGMVVFSHLLGLLTAQYWPTTLGEWLANLTILPLNYYMFSTLAQHTLLPPAWSLALEIQFYLLAPWLFIASRRCQRLAAAVSLTIFSIAQLGVIHTDWWGYRFLPGTLVIFMAGAKIQQRRKTLPIILWVIAFLLAVAIVVGAVPPQPFNREVLAGLLLGIPLVAFLYRLPRRRLDELLGRLSYPLFLSHFAVLWLCVEHGLTPAKPSFWASYLLLGSIAAWLLAYVIEVPVYNIRHTGLRGERKYCWYDQTS